MKTYDFKKIRAIQRENEHKFAALENAEGRRIIPFNTSNTQKVTIAKQLDNIEKRLKSSTLDDGYYFVLFCNSIQQCKNGYEKFAFLKGEPSEKVHNAVVLTEKVENVLSYESALANIKEIAELKSTNKILEETNKQLSERIKELETQLAEELKESEKEETSVLNEKSVSSFMSNVTPILERFFDIEEKKLNAQVQNKNNAPAGQPQKKLIRVGSKEHLDLIEQFYNEGREQEFNAQMDLLEKKDPELYHTVIELLQLEEEQEEEETEQ